MPTFIDGNLADRFINEAARFGNKLDTYPIERYRGELETAFAECEQELSNRFASEAHLFQLDNEQRICQAEIIATERAAKKLRILQERLEGQRASTEERRRRAIQLTEGQIRRLEADRDHRLARISSLRHAETASRPVSGGVILVR